MANKAKKTEHSGPKKGAGAYWGRKNAAKKESNRLRREVDKKGTIFEEEEVATDSVIKDSLTTAPGGTS